MSSVILIYLVALLLGAGGLFGISYFLKKFKGTQFRKLWLFVGVILSIAYYGLELLLFKSTFSTIDYYNTQSFKIIVGFLFLMLFCLARLILTKVIFFNRQKTDSGLSFCLGFGSAWALLFTLYLLIFTFVLAYYGIFEGPCVVDTSGRLVFVDSTAISVFRPVVGHISFSVFFLSLAMICVSNGSLLAKMAKNTIHPAISATWCILLIAVESVTIQAVLYINAIPHWAIALNGVVMAAISVLLVQFIPIRKKEPDYTKQFE